MPNPPITGLPNPASYDVGSETVIDRVTGLMWQRAASGELSIDEVASYCDELELDGYCDFRVPTRIELVSLVDFTQADPAIDSTVFGGTEGEFLSSPVSASGGRSRIGSDGATRTGTDQQVPTGRVRCVRRHVASTLPDPHYVIAGQSPDDTVTDRATGLVWQRAFKSATHSFAEARFYCQALALDGGGFRVPSMKEMQTLFDETRESSPFIDTDAFPGLPEDVPPTFWTSSLSSRSPDRAWFVRSSLALDVGKDEGVDAPFHVRCVR